MDLKTGSILLVQPRITHSLQDKRMEKIFQANSPKKQAAVATLVSDKTDFSTFSEADHYLDTKQVSTDTGKLK